LQKAFHKNKDCKRDTMWTSLLKLKLAEGVQQKQGPLSRRHLPPFPSGLLTCLWKEKDPIKV